jgi:hypothetical protein
LEEYPEYPTAREQGVTYDAIGWRGIMLPKGAPPEVVRVLNESLAEIAASDEFRQFMKKNGFAVAVRDSAEFGAYLRDQETKWAGVIKNAGYEKAGQNHDPGPRAMPILLGALLVIVLAVEGVLSRRRQVSRGSRGKGASTPEMELSLTTPTATVSEGSRWWLSHGAVFLLAALLIYITAMPWIGFAGSTTMFAFVAMWRLGTKWWLAALSAVVIVAAIHLLFVVLFKVQLP